MPNINTLIKKPSAWVPVALSAISLALILSAIAILGVPKEPPEDEGIGAHLFQLWLVLEVLMIGYFGIRWIPQAPKPALVILALQIIAVVAACAPVFYFGL